MNFIENEFVNRTYQSIADSFDSTRYKVWDSVMEYLLSLKPGSIICEVGCGNGKNLLVRKDCVNIGFDLCENFSVIASKKGIESCTANNLQLPIRSNLVDVVLSIAVIHHLSTEERRLESIKELIRITKPGGEILIQVWAKEQELNSKRQFDQQDNFVGFYDKKSSTSKKRFYHVFVKNELDNLILKCSNVKVVFSKYEKGNWIVLCQKIKY